MGKRRRWGGVDKRPAPPVPGKQISTLPLQSFYARTEGDGTVTVVRGDGRVFRGVVTL